MREKKRQEQKTTINNWVENSYNQRTCARLKSALKILDDLRVLVQEIAQEADGQTVQSREFSEAAEKFGITVSESVSPKVPVKDSKIGGIVVGRRGTGKCAIYYKLKKETEGDKTIIQICRAPKEEDLLEIRGAVKKRSNNYKVIRVIVKLCWKYSILVQIAMGLTSNYKLPTLARLVTWARLPACSHPWYCSTVDNLKQWRGALAKYRLSHGVN